MNSAIVAAALKAGIVTQQQLAELKRFRVPGIPADAETELPKTLDEAAAIIFNVLQSEGFVMVRETDLSVVHNFLKDVHTGQLHIESSDVAFPVQYSLTSLGEYVIPWRGEGIAELMITGETFLLLENDVSCVSFSAVRELFFGEQKAFMVCSVRQTWIKS